MFDELEMAEGRHSAPWREEDHPRAPDGRFGHSSGTHTGGVGGGNSGGSGSHPAPSGGGQQGKPKPGTGTKAGITRNGKRFSLTRTEDGSGSLTLGGKEHDLNPAEFKALTDGLSVLRYTPVSKVPSVVVGGQKSITVDSSPDDSPIAVVKRTEHRTFTLHMRPRPGASEQETANAPGITLTDNDAGDVGDTADVFDQERREEERRVKEEQRKANVAAGRNNPADVARRASGQPPSTTGPNGRGMPATIASKQLSTVGGGRLTVHRRAGDDRTHVTIGDGRSFALTGDELRHLDVAVSNLDDDDELKVGEGDGVVDSEGLLFGHVTKAGSGRYDVQIDGQPAFTLSPKDAGRLEQTGYDLSTAKRLDTEYGPVDVYPAGGGKFGIRHIGDDGRPVETVFTAGSWRKLDRALTVVHEGFDEEDTDPNAPDEGVTRQDVKTNVGPVAVELKGEWGAPGSSLLVTPASGIGWGVAIDGPNMSDWMNAVSGLLEESARGRRRRNLTEQVSLTEAAGGQALKGRKFRARIIQGDIQGSSGYYPAATLRRDAGVFREGLPVFLDHPGATEAYERPERSVRDLAGRLASTAVYDGDGLYADVEVYPHWAPVIEAMAPHIGMSIRASGTVEASRDESIAGPIVTSLTEAASVDFVTAAGAGGKIVALLESARAQGALLRRAVEAKAPPTATKTGEEPADLEGAEIDDEDVEDQGDEPQDGQDTKKKGKPAFLKAKEAGLDEVASLGQWLESRLHLGFTKLADDMFGDGRLTRDERIGLSQAVGDGLKVFTARVEADYPHLYQRALWDDPEQGDDPDALPENPTTKGAPMSGSTIKEQAPPHRGADVTESARERELAAQLAEATKAAETAQAALTEAQAATAARVAALEAKVAESDAKTLRLENDQAARKVCAEALKGCGLPEAAHAKVTEAIVRDIPAGENGVLDGARLAEAVKKAIQDEKTYLAMVAEASGIGAVRGLGESQREISASDIDSELEEAFKGLGMSDSAAKTAVHGRA
ncbi:hypothetical protein AB0395_41275 [Streptosporangium sp. NPDC051023]|uniref:hypothetical protein n=1 Tax=Streptosporangium sp. NPDC051023 TaxID=3155410 RepID=UPI00344DBB2E